MNPLRMDAPTVEERRMAYNYREQLHWAALQTKRIIELERSLRICHSWIESHAYMHYGSSIILLQIESILKTNPLCPQNGSLICEEIPEKE